MSVVMTIGRGSPAAGEAERLGGRGGGGGGTGDDGDRERGKGG